MQILLADDHALVRENLRDFLTVGPLGAMVTEAASFAEAIDVAKRAHRLDLILLDLMMPGMNGITGVMEMVLKNPNVPVVVLSGSTRQGDIDGAMKLGAKGFIPKTLRPSELVQAIKTVLNGGIFVPDMAGFMGVAVRAGPQTAAAASALEDEALRSLTPREREVLDLLIKGYPNKKIANELNLREITVKVHLQNVYRKLGVSNHAHAVSKALSCGWTESRTA